MTTQILRSSSRSGARASLGLVVLGFVVALLAGLNLTAASADTLGAAAQASASKAITRGSVS
jgi:hypothetical protein